MHGVPAGGRGRFSGLHGARRAAVAVAVLVMETLIVGWSLGQFLASTISWRG